MDFGLTEEQRLIVETTRAFVENELYPHEAEVERTGVLRPELIAELKAKAIEAGLYAANMPDEVGGAGLDTVTWLLYEKELGRANYALHWTCVARPSNILLRRHDGAAREVPVPLHPRREVGLPGDDRAGRRLGPARHEGDRRAGRRRLGAERHQAFHQPCRHRRFRHRLHGVGRGRDAARQAQEDHRLLRRQGHQGLHRARRLPQRLASRLHQFDPRIRRLPAAASQVLGEVHKGFEVANSWLGATRLQVGATCLGRAERALGHAIDYAAQREQFGQQIGKFQGVSFKLADMAIELKAAELMILEAAGNTTQGTVTDQDMAMAKLKATEMLAFVADEAIQIHGGMGLMDELPLERIWRDARVERIWEGTSEIQRHIISRALLRAVGG